MPFHVGNSEEAHEILNPAKHQPSQDNVKLKILTDIICLRYETKTGSIIHRDFSIGDVLINLGLIVGVLQIIIWPNKKVLLSNSLKANLSIQ